MSQHDTSTSPSSLEAKSWAANPPASSHLCGYSRSTVKLQYVFQCIVHLACFSTTPHGLVLPLPSLHINPSLWACSSAGSFILWGIISNHWIPEKEVVRAIQEVSEPLRTLFSPRAARRSAFLPFMGFQGIVKTYSANSFQPHVSHVCDICLLLPGYIFSGLDEILNKDSCFYFRKFCVSL